MGKFEELKVWQRSVDLSVYVYEVIERSPLSKDFGLRDQMQRASVSIPSNIAEGDELNTQKQSINFFYNAKASSAELYTQTIIAERTRKLNEIDSNHIMCECKIISRMLGKLIAVRSQTL